MGTPETNRASAGWHELTVEKWVYGGNGLGRLDGRAVLVPYVLPGELVQIKIEREKPGLLEARLAAVLSPAPERANPPCPFFSRCGGCQYQHADYEFQLTQKLSVLREVFRRVGKLQSPEQIGLISASPWEYRNRAKFHLAGGKIGYLETGSHRLCPVDRCPISSPRSTRRWPSCAKCSTTGGFRDFFGRSNCSPMKQKYSSMFWRQPVPSPGRSLSGARNEFQARLPARWTTRLPAMSTA
jgi:predicted RNA-binding protein with TRAM domain